ncbi:hypothetical protein ES703_62760 [subsurface metagenome]
MNRVREQGQRVHCAANLRQFTFAWTMYAMDNDDKLCSPATGWGAGNWVADGPDWPDNDIGNTEEAIEDGALWPYTQTSELYKCKTDRTDLLRSYSTSSKMVGRLHKISRPAEKMVFIDASSNWKWIHGSFFPVNCCTKQPEWQPWDWRHLQQITARHNHGFHISVATNHYKYWRWKDRRTIKFANRQISAADASDNNPDIERLLKLLKGHSF